MSLRRALAAAALAALFTVPAAAQDWTGTGRLEGRVSGPDGQPVAGATVKLDYPARGGGPTVKTDKKGKWAYLGIVAGPWNIDVEAPGFTTRKVTVSLPAEGARVPPIEITLEKAAPTGPPPEVVAAIAKAEEAYKAGRHDEAVAEYQRLLAMRPDLSTTIHQQLGFAYIQMKDYPKALEHLRKVMEADPANVQIRAIAAQAALEGGLLEEGRALLSGLDETTVKNPDVFYNMGVNFLNANQPEEAIVYFGKAIAVDAAYADGYYRRALAYLQTGKMAEAKADFQKVIELTPEGDQADASRKALEALK
jgi:tetratricopeptide (TPR) repeat protein